jgi:hypothetical protein
VLQQSRPWLSTVPWPVVVQSNEDFCRSKGLTPTLNPKTGDTARQAWERAGQQALTLEQALEVCRQCNRLIPFTFGSERTFVTIGLTLIDDLLRRLPKDAAVEAQILRHTVGNYVVGLISKRELHQVFRHFEPFWARSRTLNTAAAGVAAIQAQVS